MAEKKKAAAADNLVPYNELFEDFERLANQSQDAIYHYDIGSKRFLFQNKNFNKFFQLDNDPGKTTRDQLLHIIHPEDRKDMLKAFEKSLAAGQTEGEIAYRVQYPDGSIRWLEDRWIVLRGTQGDPFSFQGFIRDNTSQKLSELQFIGSKQNALIGSYIVQDNQFKYVNPQFISITGYSELELIGRNSMTLVHEDYRDHVRKRAKAMLKGEDLTPYEFCVSGKSGSTHWAMETVTSVIYRGKRAALGCFMDVTNLHEMRDNLSTLGLMLGTISHSLRGCLTGLKASLYLVEAGFYRDNAAQIEEGLDVTKLMVDRVQKLVLDILYYSKRRDLEIEAVDIWRFVQEITIQMERRIKAADIEFITDFPNDAGTFAIDTETIRTALTNILENAMEACIEDPRNTTHSICFTARVDEENVYFDISDNGPGMDKNQVAEIFRLFSSTKGKRGTGIGLFVTRKAILKHGGGITVDSSLNEGASFHITLPRKPRSRGLKKH